MISKSISAVVGLGFLAMSSAQAANVSLNPADSSVGVGGSFTLQVDASGFSIPTIGAELGVDYNPAVLSLDAATWNPNSPFEDDVTLVNDIVSFYTFAEASGDFQVVDLQFTVLSNTPTKISLIDQETNLLGWFDTSGNPISGITYDGASVNVNPVPLPAAVWMMLGGLGLLGWTGKRRAAQS